MCVNRIPNNNMKPKIGERLSSYTIQNKRRRRDGTVLYHVCVVRVFLYVLGAHDDPDAIKNERKLKAKHGENRENTIVAVVLMHIVGSCSCSMAKIRAHRHSHSEAQRKTQPSILYNNTKIRRLRIENTNPT